MNKLTQIFLVLFMICLPVTLWADNDKDDDDSRYLAGAVPEVDGRVVFSREFSIPGMSQDEIYERMLKWLDGRMAQNKNNSRVVYKEKGVIAAAGEEWLVFSSTALSLDRTWLTYQVTVNCQPQKCTMEVEKIRYTYREKEKYAAEEWITDKYALNKAKTKMVRGLAKWRRKTVNFADNLFEEAAKALSQKPMEAKAEATPKKPAVVTAPKVVVIGDNQETGKVEKAAEQTAVLKSANMSMGINLLMKLLKDAAKVLAPAGYDIELVERHHNQKVDAPSGTALALADSVNEALDHEYTYVYDRSQYRKKREEKEIGISAVRGGTIVGEHEVIFAGMDEVIEFKHTAYSRSVFGKGAVEAAKFLAGKTAGMYDMSDVIQF